MGCTLYAVTGPTFSSQGSDLGMTVAKRLVSTATGLHSDCQPMLEPALGLRSALSFRRGYSFLILADGAAPAFSYR